MIEGGAPSEPLGQSLYEAKVTGCGCLCDRGPYTGTDSKDRAFFKRLSTSGGDQITVTENISELLPELLRSMTAR